MTTQNEKSLASKRYLEPLSKESTNGCTLSLYFSPNGEKFRLELFQRRTRIRDGKEETYLATPSSTEASLFVERRFKHGFKKLNPPNCFHPVYEVPATDYTVSLIRAAWTGEFVLSDSAKNKFNSIFIREFIADRNAKRSAEFKDSSTIPSTEWFDAHDKHLSAKGITLSPYQKVAAFNACQVRSYGLFCDPGTGKTAMMIRKLDYTISEASSQTLSLVVCPKNCRTNWEREIYKFSMHAENIQCLTLNGNSPVDRTINFLNAVVEAGNKHIVLIVGYEGYVTTSHLHSLEWENCFIDESHNLANPSTRRTKTFLETRSNFKNKMIATGTPFRNLPFDIFPQFEFLGEGFSGFDSFAAFKGFYGEYDFNPFKGAQLVAFKNIPLLQEKIAKHCFVIRKEEALPSLPKKLFAIRECDMSPSQTNTYIQLATQLAAEIESYGPNPDSITVQNILVQMLRLAQITSGFVPTDSGELTRFNENPKLDLLCELLLGSEEGSPGVLQDKNQKAIVWCAFRENVKMITSRLALDGIKAVSFSGDTQDKDEVVDAFNNDRDTRVFVGIAKSGGVGLNLVGFDPSRAAEYTTNTSHVFFYSSNWSGIERSQAMDRAHRHNTRVPVTIIDLLVPRTIDMEIYHRVQDKIQMSLSIQDIKKVLSMLK